MCILLSLSPFTHSVCFSFCFWGCHSLSFCLFSISLSFCLFSISLFLSVLYLSLSLFLSVLYLSLFLFVLSLSLSLRDCFTSLTPCLSLCNSYFRSTILDITFECSLSLSLSIYLSISIYLSLSLSLYLCIPRLITTPFLLSRYSFSFCIFSLQTLFHLSPSSSFSLLFFFL